MNTEEDFFEKACTCVLLVLIITLKRNIVVVTRRDSVVESIFLLAAPLLLLHRCGCTLLFRIVLKGIEDPFLISMSSMVINESIDLEYLLFQPPYR